MDSKFRTKSYSNKTDDGQTCVCTHCVCDKEITGMYTQSHNGAQV